MSLPASATGPSGMNALAHCVEALYAKEQNPISSIVAEEGIRALAVGLPGCVRVPEDLDARSEALYGAFLAGSALAVVGMAVHHRICHVLGGTFGLSHGDVDAVILPHVARYNREAAPGALARAARALGATDAPTALYDLAVEIGAPTSLAELGMQESDLDQAAELAAIPPPWNPRAVKFEDVRALLDDAFHGSDPARRPARRSRSRRRGTDGRAEQGPHLGPGRSHEGRRRGRSMDGKDPRGKDAGEMSTELARLLAADLWSRRRFLRTAGIGGAAIGLSGLLAACRVKTARARRRPDPTRHRPVTP